LTVPNAPSSASDLMPPRWREPAAVYRLWDANGNLLYIGSAYDPDHRCKSHRRKPWWPEVASRTEEWHSSRGAAYAEEMKAIRTEGSKYNSMGTPGYTTPQTEAILRRNELNRLRARALSDSATALLAAERAVEANGGSRRDAVKAGLLAKIDFLDQKGLHERLVGELRAQFARRFGSSTYPA
jgi:predicted GIY-YIG superfamily endonuclease